MFIIKIIRERKIDHLDILNDLDFTISKNNAIGNFTIIRKGKKKYFVIKHI